MLSYIFQGTFALWIATVVFQYFQYHPEFSKAFINSPKIFFSFFIIFALIYGAYFLFQGFVNDKEKITFKLHPLSLIGIGISSLLLISIIIFSKASSSLGTDIFSAFGALISKIFPVFITLGFIFILSFLIGDAVSRLLKIEWVEEKKGLVNIGFGISIILFLLFLLGIFGLIKSWLILSVGLILFLVCFKSYKSFYDWLFAINKKEEEFEFFSIDTFLWISLFFMIGINLFDILRPMPIGWDDMGVYLNMPQRIAEDGAVLAGQGGQAWMLLTSLGFELWPKYIGDMVAMYINWFGGMLSVFAVYVFTKRFFTGKIALFSAVFYYFMPMITFQSALDMKMDPTLFFFMVTAALVLFDKTHGLLGKIKDLTHTISLEDKIKWGVGGIILATAFFIKITTAMQIFAFIALISFFIFNWKTALGVIFLETSIFLLGFAQVPEFTDLIKNSLVFGFGLTGIVLILISKIKTYQIKHFLDIGVSVGIGFLLIAGPWFVFNLSNSSKINFRTLTNGQFHEAPVIDWKSVGIDREGKDKKWCVSSGKKEEQGRYIGADQPFIKKYFTLPWKNTMNSEARGYYLNIGFLFLALIPGLFLLGIWRKWGKKEWGILILFSVNWFFWAFAANGIPWYGLFGFLPALILTGLVLFDKKQNKTFWKYIFIGLILISIISFAYLRETKTGNGSTIKYAFGVTSAKDFVDGVVLTYRKTVELIDSYPRTESDPAYLFRAGTFIPYFIKDVRRVMLTDSQLDKFRCIDGDGADNKRTLERLRKLGFKFFIFDTNTATIEKNKNGTLHKKVERFIKFAQEELKIIYSAPQNGIAFMFLK